MLIVISDLHFEEERLDWRGVLPVEAPLPFTRNFDPKAFVRLRAWLASDIEAAKLLNGVDLVLAGDIFDLHRTTMWLDGNIRPWDDPTKFAPGTAHEGKVIEILGAIAKEPSVDGSLKAISSFASLPGLRVHYLPGNHDRLANATPLTRKTVRRLLGMPESDAPFPHVFVPTEGDPPVLVRHGHEYDPFNFAADYTDRTVPLLVPEAEYAAATFGDFVTVQLASALVDHFRKTHADRIADGASLERAVYARLLEFDDVRPQSAVFNFLFANASATLDERAVWRCLQPVVQDLFQEVRTNPFFLGWFERLSGRMPARLYGAAQVAIQVAGLADQLQSGKSWRPPVPWSLVHMAGQAAHGIGKAAADQLLPVVRQDEWLSRESARAVVAGHTHAPQVALLESFAEVEKYYIDTGTWRTSVPTTPEQKQFGHTRAATYVVAYGRREDPGTRPRPAGTTKTWSFDYWSGYTQRWFQ